MYVYVSNESPQDVYFDDVKVTHNTGPLLQENHYYPYGLSLATISDKAALKLKNNFLYNGGAELEDEDGITYYNTFYRKYDAQTGRFTGIDIFAEKYNSWNPYQFGKDNPVLFNDPTGALTSFELNQIVSKLWNSSYGGSWSANSGGEKGFAGGSSIALFGDKFTADFFGGLAASGNSFGFGGDGNFRMNGVFVTSIGSSFSHGNHGISVGGYYEQTGDNPNPVMGTKFFKNSNFGFGNSIFPDFSSYNDVEKKKIKHFQVLL